MNEVENTATFPNTGDPKREESNKATVSSSEKNSPNSASSGRTVYGPHDPLGWSWKKKHAVLAAMCYMTFMTDFLAGYGVPMIIPQAREWHISSVDSTRSLSGNTFMQGFGSLVAVPFTQRFGTLPVMFWSTFLTVIMTMACAVCPDWIGFIAVRVIQGFFATAAQVLGMTVIQDIFFFEQHAREIGIWGWSILIGPYFGPFLGSFILRGTSWRVAFWIASAFAGFGLILVIFVVDETYYDREVPENNPPRPESYLQYKLESLIGIQAYRAKGRTTLWQATLEVVHVLIRPQFWTLALYHGLTYMWSVGINGTLILFLTPTPPTGYGFSTVAVGLMYFAPMIAVVLGELWGHFFNDFIQLRYVRKHEGIFQPETRLWALYFATVFMAVGLGLLGVSLEHLWHWFAVAFFWGIFVFAAMTSTVAISAYELDCFPDQSAAASALLNFARVLFGFLVPYFQTQWANSVGASWSFGTQALICVAAFAIIPVIQNYGKRWRQATEYSPDVIKVDNFR